MHWIDPDCLPVLTGKVERLVANPSGECDGVVLIDADGDARLVHIPPHLSDEARAALRSGEQASVRGVKPRGAELIAAVSLETSDGREIVDRGPSKDKHKDKPKRAEPASNPASVSGTVRLTLFSPKGEARGALLADGTVLRLEPRDADRWLIRLKPGASIAVRGRAIETSDGTVVAVSEIEAGEGVFEPIGNPKPAKPKPEKHPQRLDESAASEPALQALT